MAIITISRQYGTGGYQMTQRMAAVLGYKYFSREISEIVAKKMGSSSQIIREYEEFMYHRTDWTFDSIGGRFTYTKKNAIHKSDYVKLTTEIICTLAKEGDVIILGRGGQCVLKNYPGVIHFRIVADIEERMQHIINHYADPTIIPNRKMLEYKIKWVDGIRSKYIKIHYGENIDNPALYHVIFNLSKLGREKVLQLIFDIIGK